MKIKNADFAPTQPLQLPAGSPDQELNAGWPTRIIYCLALLGLTIGQLGQGAWFGLATGGGLLGLAGMSVFLFLAAGVVYRVYLVLRYKAALSARTPCIFGWFFRVVGCLVMACGAFGLMAMFAVKPLTLLVLKSAGENGAGFFVIGLYAVMLASAGWMGCLLFELSRIMGKRPTQPKPAKSPRQRKQDLAVAATTIALIVGIPYSIQLVAGEPCYGPTLTRCMANIDGAVTRPAMVPFGDAIKLETNIDEMVFIKQLEPRREVKENPVFSLLKSGHPAQDGAATSARVVLNAANASKGV